MNFVQVIRKLNECAVCGDLQGFVDFVKEEPQVIDKALEMLQKNYTDITVKDRYTYGYTVLRHIDKDFLLKAKAAFESPNNNLQKES